MSRPNAFITMTAGGVALVFCLACLTGERFGVSQAHAQPAGTPDPAGTPVPFGDPGTGDDPSPTPCPPPSFTWTNPFEHSVEVGYTCSNMTGSGLVLQTNQSVVFDGNVDGHCNGCDQGDDSCACIECGLIRLVVEGLGTVFSCGAQQAYLAAYELDLAAEISKGFVPQFEPKSLTDQFGFQLQQHVIPVLDDERNLVGWEFTAIVPKFSVEDGEVVIRARTAQSVFDGDKLVADVNQGDVIGGPEGITIDDRPE